MCFWGWFTRFFDKIIFECKQVYLWENVYLLVAADNQFFVGGLLVVLTGWEWHLTCSLPACVNFFIGCPDWVPLGGLRSSIVKECGLRFPLRISPMRYSLTVSICVSFWSSYGKLVIEDSPLMFAGWETSARQCEWKFGRASGKQDWASGILYRLYKRLPSSGECQKFLVSQPGLVNYREYIHFFKHSFNCNLNIHLPLLIRWLWI